MSPSQERTLELCQQVETMLREVQRLAGSGKDGITVCETQLGQAAALLEDLHKSTPPAALQRSAAVRELLRDIQRLNALLKMQFEHGANYCMGLLQMRLGTGYSEQGLPVLVSSEARTLFQG
jgi:hypothetical protein